jgi:DNA-binding transcriptional ArsR family regulator
MTPSSSLAIIYAVIIPSKLVTKGPRGCGLACGFLDCSGGGGSDWRGGVLKSVKCSYCMEVTNRMGVVAGSSMLARLQAVEAGVARLSEMVSCQEEVVRLLHDGLRSYRERVLGDRGVLAYDRLLGVLAARVRGDASLGLAHRKLLEVLSAAFDHQQRKFLEVSFSVLVRQAHVGRSRAGAHLRSLMARGLITVRSDGYRKYYRLDLPREAATGSFRGEV